MSASSLIFFLYRLFFFIDQKKIKETAKKLRDFDTAISHFYPMNWIAIEAKKRYGVRYIYHNHGVGEPRLFTKPGERLYMNIFRHFNNDTIKKCDEAVSISNYLRDVLKAETGVNSKVVYDRIDAKRFRKGLDKSRIRKKLKIGNSPMFLFVGRISPHKGVHLLIKAFNLANIKDAKLIIIGKHTFQKYSKALRQMAGRDVIFIRDVKDNDLPYYYAACDAYTTASLWEGFNLTVVEAQSCGRPVVAYNTSSHPEVVKKGILVEPENTDLFADAMVKIIK